MDPRSQILGSRGSSPRWMDSIPGYRGYKDKELRREADRALRQYLAAKLDATHRQLDDVKRTMLSGGGLSQLAPVERASTKLQTLIDTLKSASYGYAGLFDSDAVREPQLDALFAFDQALDEQVDALTAKVATLRAAVGGTVGVSESLDALTTAIDELLAEARTRDEAILSGKGLPVESPRDVLNAPQTSAPEFQALRALRLKDAVAIATTNLIVGAREVASLNGATHILLRLDGGAESRWLWIGPTESDLAVMSPGTLTDDPFKADTITIEADSLRLLSRGQGSVNLDGPSGSKRDVPAQIAVFRSDLQAIWAEKTGNETTILTGITTDPKSIQVFRR